MSAVGGILIMAIGLNILDFKKNKSREYATSYFYSFNLLCVCIYFWFIKVFYVKIMQKKAVYRRYLMKHRVKLPKYKKNSINDEI